MQTSDTPRSPTSAAREIPEQFRSQRHRLAKVIDLARVYRDCGVEELARDLGRDPTRLVSDSGNPKIDLVIGLSRVLEWPVTEVVKAIRGDDGVPEPPASNSNTFQKYSELMEESLKAHRSGRWQELLDIAKAMLVRATTPNEHALACNRMSGAFDGMGRYAHALKTLQQGMNEHGVSESVGILLRANLANAHYALWNLAEARAISGEVIDDLSEASRRSRSERVMAALSRYVRANTIRRMIAEETKSAEVLCMRAREDLRIGQEELLALAEEFADDSYRGVANTCAGALLDIDAASGVMEPARALRHIESGLAEAFRASSMPAGDQLESWGWWAIFGCNIALRHLPIERSNDQIARLHLHLHAASERLENWAFRAKAFGIELQRREHARQAGLDLEAWRLTPKQMENLVHTMGRLPAFQATGWRILTEFGVLEQANRIDPRTWRKGLIEV